MTSETPVIGAGALCRPQSLIWPNSSDPRLRPIVRPTRDAPCTGRQVNRPRFDLGLPDASTLTIGVSIEEPLNAVLVPGTSSSPASKSSTVRFEKKADSVVKGLDLE